VRGVHRQAQGLHLRKERWDLPQDQLLLLMRQEQGETVPWVGVAPILEIFSDYYRG
jgi:hypothetical protein